MTEDRSMMLEANKYKWLVRLREC